MECMSLVTTFGWFRLLGLVVALDIGSGLKSFCPKSSCLSFFRVNWSSLQKQSKSSWVMGWPGMKWTLWTLEDNWYADHKGACQCMGSFKAFETRAVQKKLFLWSSMSSLPFSFRGKIQSQTHIDRLPEKTSPPRHQMEEAVLLCIAQQGTNPGVLTAPTFWGASSL